MGAPNDACRPETNENFQNTSGKNRKEPWSFLLALHQYGWFMGAPLPSQDRTAIQAAETPWISSSKEILSPAKSVFLFFFYIERILMIE